MDHNVSKIYTVWFNIFHVWEPPLWNILPLLQRKEPQRQNGGWKKVYQVQTKIKPPKRNETQIKNGRWTKVHQDKTSGKKWNPNQTFLERKYKRIENNKLQERKKYIYFPWKPNKNPFHHTAVWTSEEERNVLLEPVKIGKVVKRKNLQNVHLERADWNVHIPRMKQAKPSGKERLVFSAGDRDPLSASQSIWPFAAE